MQKYEIGQQLEFIDVSIRPLYGCKIVSIFYRFELEWTALRNNIEGHKKGEIWHSYWTLGDIKRDLQLCKPIYNLPEDLFKL